jgi:hypothetical protein
MVIACAGYRVTAKTSHHKISFDSIEFALGSAAGKYADYFETCRRKRNVIDYTRSHAATDWSACGYGVSFHTNRKLPSLAVATIRCLFRVARFNADRTFSLLSVNCASGTLSATPSGT